VSPSSRCTACVPRWSRLWPLKVRLGAFPVLQKLVGHSRLMMTLYYTKPRANRIRDVLVGAAQRLEAAKQASIQNFLLDTEHDLLLQQAVCNSPASLSAAIPQHPAARIPAGWMPMHHGLCLVGGNTSKVESVATPYADLGLGVPSLSDAQLLDAMLEHPILVNRPLVVTPLGVRLCRPSEIVLDILPAAQKGAFAKEDGEPVTDSEGRRVRE
jgi:hypothetical protein